MQSQPRHNWNAHMEPVLHIADMLIAECHTKKTVISQPILHALLFYTQGWHEIFFDEPCFEASLDDTSDSVLFPAVQSAFKEFHGQLYAARAFCGPTEDKLTAAIVASYGQGPVSKLLDQTNIDVRTLRRIKSRHNLNTSQAFKQHFAHLATPQVLRTNPFHGLFVDTYRARKSPLVDWTPPRDPTPEEIAEFEQIQIV